jgi:putative aminopeptidase FrvX
MEIDSVTFLEELLAIPSPSGEEDAVAEYLVEQMTGLGWARWGIRRPDGRSCF